MGESFNVFCRCFSPCKANVHHEWDFHKNRASSVCKMVVLFFQSWNLLHINALDKVRWATELYSLIWCEWKGLWKISALSRHFQRYPHPDCSGKLKEVASSVWAAVRWGRLYYISIYFPQHLSNFSQARLTACSVSDNLRLCGRLLYGLHVDYELCLLKK